MKKKLFIVGILFFVYMLISSKETYAATVYNQTDFLNVLNNTSDTSIVIGTSIDFTNAISVSRTVTITASSENNAMRWKGSGNFITINSGGNLTIGNIVVDVRGSNGSSGINCIRIKSGGILACSGFLVDSGMSNVGVLIESGGTFNMGRGDIVYANKGIRCIGTGKLNFTSSSSNMSFWNNNIAVVFEGSWTGTCNFNKSGIKMYNNAHGILLASAGTVNVSAGSYYSNTSVGMHARAGTLNISGGSIYSNPNGVNMRAGALNISGGSISSNTNTGVYLESGYTGKFKMTGGTIQSNTNYAIYHAQTADSTCTIQGGTVSGYVYLAGSDNYVNTNSSYPTLSIKPSTYTLGRKLVKTASNTAANTEISKVTMAASGSWYKYVQNEYIVVWSGGNVIVKHVDQSGNALVASELINGSIGSAYTTSAKNIEGYALVTTPSNATGTFTSADITATYVYALIKGSITITNVDNIDGTKLLSGGTFKLEKLDDSGNLDSTFTAVELTAGDNGTVIFENVLPGKYIITQTKAVEGYNLNKNAVEIETAIGNIDAAATVKNIAKVALPETGDTNYSVIISLTGIVLITGAVIISNIRRKNINKEMI